MGSDTPKVTMTASPVSSTPVASLTPGATQWTIDALAPLRDVLSEWPAALPSAKGDPVRALVIGAHDQLVGRLRPDQPQALETLKRVLKHYANSSQYQAALAAPDAMRHALDGTPAEPVADEHARYARMRVAGIPSTSRKERLVVRTTSRSLKTTLVLDATSFAGLKVPDGQSRVLVEVEVAGRTVTASINAKSVRKAAAIVAEHGPDMVAVILQGALAVDNTLTDAGITAQVKQPKPTSLLTQSIG